MLIGSFFLLLLAACNKDQPPPEDPESGEGKYSIELIDEYLLDIAEPSGLSWALNKKDLLLVDDRTNQAYIISTTGKNLSTLAYKGDDTEGITIDGDNKEIWIAEEAESKLIRLDSAGKEIDSYLLDFQHDSKKKGLEGLTYDAQSKTFYVLNEAEPGLLITWQLNKGILTKKELQFAQDYSGIFFDNADQSLWIVSDQSKQLFYCDKAANVKQSFGLDFQKAEGVVVDTKLGRVYIVSDSEHKLYVYKIQKL